LSVLGFMALLALFARCTIAPFSTTFTAVTAITVA
jgi:hypothetical protein